ncbi:unnamed protein product [Lepeophtheirus salmonis]|uniref:(salmon louse) hypothetical protein n=1 Tax=Lepeophtheirus salmonis TaxID=72036 RepID=A0A7R8H6H1_LEPSM|nr:unnamed protein product [Lepeophtheirus salmonis]CAF2888571.1 unnamed protein product [Lepeophtheirus salmonis]
MWCCMKPPNLCFKSIFRCLRHSDGSIDDFSNGIRDPPTQESVSAMTLPETNPINTSVYPKAINIMNIGTSIDNSASMDVIPNAGMMNAFSSKESTAPQPPPTPKAELETGERVGEKLVSFLRSNKILELFQKELLSTEARLNISDFKEFMNASFWFGFNEL